MMRPIFFGDRAPQVVTDAIQASADMPGSMSSPRLANTSTSMNADHGEELFERGNVGHYAPFDYGVIETPEPEVIQEDGSEWELRIVQRGLMSSVFYSFCPFDVVVPFGISR